MTKLTNPFLDLDVTKLMSDFKVPGVDMEVVVSTQRKNVEALTKANQLALEGFQAVARRQAEIVRQGFHEASSLMRDLISSKTQEDRVAVQTDAAKKVMETALVNARELAELVTKAQNEAFDVLNKRVGESIDEVRHLVKKPGAR